MSEQDRSDHPPDPGWGRPGSLPLHAGTSVTEGSTCAKTTTHRGEITTSKEVRHCDEVTISKEAGYCDEVTTPKEAGHCDEVATPKEVRLYNEVTTPQEAGQCDEVTTPKEAGHCDEVTIPKGVGHCDEVTTPKEAGHGDEVTTSKEVASRDTDTSTLVPAGKAGELVMNIPQHNDGDIYIGGEVTTTHNYNELHQRIECHGPIHCHRMVQNTVIYQYCRESHEQRQDKDAEVDVGTPDIEPFCFIHTDSLEKATDVLDKLGQVVICGPPGSGKTTLGHALLRYYGDKGFLQHSFAHVYQLLSLIAERGRRCIVLLDGVLGCIRVNRHEFDEMMSKFCTVLRAIKNGRCMIVITVYPHIMNELQCLDHHPFSPLLTPVLQVILAETPLSPQQKIDMIKMHTEELHLCQDEQDLLIKEILRKDESGAGFPWCCQRLVNYWKSLVDPTVFFSAPAEIYVPLLRRMFLDLEHGETFAAVMLLKMMGFSSFLKDPQHVQQHLKALGLSKFSCDRLEQYVAVLRCFILNKNGSEFQNRAIYDAVGLALGRSSRLPILLKVCDVRFLVQYVRTEETASELFVTVGHSPDDRQLLMQTMYKHMVSGQLLEVCQHPSLHSPQFLQEFEAFLQENKYCVKKLIRAGDPVQKMSILYWSVWFNSGNLTFWVLKLMEKQPWYAVNSDQLLKAAFACALMENFMEHYTPRFKAVAEMLVCMPKFVLTKFIFTDVESKFLLPPRELCITGEIQALKNQMKAHLQVGNVCYLRDTALTISDRLVKIKVGDSNEIDMAVPSKQWYLVQRLMVDRRVDETDDEGNTLLHVAADTGDVEAVKIVVKSGASLTARNKKGKIPPQLASARKRLNWKQFIHKKQKQLDLHKACQDGDLEKVKTLLCTGVSFQDRDRAMCTPLHAACKAGQSEIASLLISLNADVNARDKYGNTPLHSACQTGLTDIAAQLICHGADVNARDRYMNTPLHDACRLGKMETAVLLVQNGADLHVLNKDWSTPLRDAVRSGDSSSAYLLQHTENGMERMHGVRRIYATFKRYSAVFPRTDTWLFTMLCVLLILSTFRSDTALHEAARSGQVEAAQSMIQKQADINARGKGGNTPLHLASKFGHTEMVSMLTRNWADIHVRNNKEQTPLHLACISGTYYTVLLLLQSGADVNARDEEGYTPLYYACRNGDSKTVNLLIQRGANVNAQTFWGIRPLHFAFQSGDIQTVRILIDHKADINIGANLRKDIVSMAVFLIFALAFYEASAIWHYLRFWVPRPVWCRFQNMRTV